MPRGGTKSIPRQIKINSKKTPMINKIICSIILSSFCATTLAQEPKSIYNSDTYSESSVQAVDRPNITDNKIFQMLNVPIILVATGGAYKAFDNRFNSTRNSFIPKFEHHYDDVTQYLPAAVMLGLKAFNAHGGGRSTWGNMLTADVFGIAIMSAAVNGIKYTTNVRRPANGAYNSFPSGHTATAFMTATMLHKEYGHVSPLYSIGAYAVASTTGITRLLNNKHWASDVFVGAAIGIVSVELGYLIADRLFKNKNYSYPEYNSPSFGGETSPSFIGLYTGIDVNMSNYTTYNGEKTAYKSGSKSGVEGAWFINPYIGVGGLVTASTSFVSVGSQKSETAINTIGTLVGAYFSYPLSSVIRVGTKALVGANFISNHNEIPTTFSPNAQRVNLQTGASISYLARRNLAFRLFADYSHSPKFIMNRALNELTCGVAINIIL